MGKTTEPPESASLEAQDANAFFIIQAEDSSSEEEAPCQQRLGAPARLLGNPCLGFRNWTTLARDGNCLRHPHNAQMQNTACTTDPPSREHLLDTCRALSML